MPINFRLLFTAIVAVGLCASATTRNRITTLEDLHPPVEINTSERPKITLAWANDNWNGDDKPYQRIKRDVDLALESGPPADYLLRQSQSLAQNKPKDPQAQFQWSYTAWKVVKLQRHFYNWYDAYQIISSVLARTASPNTYDYVRLRYLVAHHDPMLVALGERLLKHDPKDAFVKYRLCDDYDELLGLRYQQTHQVDLETKKRALFLVQQLIQDNPGTAKYYAVRGGIYTSCWVLNKNIEDATKGLASYQEFMKLAPLDDDGRRHIQDLIDMLQEYLSSTTSTANRKRTR